MKTKLYKSVYKLDSNTYTVIVKDSECVNSNDKIVNVTYEKKHNTIFDSADYSFTKQYKVTTDESNNEFIWEQLDDNELDESEEEFFEDIEADAISKYCSDEEDIIED